MNEIAYQLLVYLCIGAPLSVVIYVGIQHARRVRRSESILLHPAEDQPVTKRPRETHAIRLGTSMHIARVGMDLGRIAIVGWHQHWWQWEPGDFLTLYVGERTTRYRIDKIEGRKSDAYFWAECTFAPRGA